MPRILSKEQQYIIDERDKIITLLVDKWYSDAVIARIMFNVHRSMITRLHKKLIEKSIIIVK